jgi:hypothetical protein
MPEKTFVAVPLVGRRQAAVMLGRRCTRTLDRLEQSDPAFPARVTVGNGFAYRADELQHWVDARPRVSRATVVKKAAA